MGGGERGSGTGGYLPDRPPLRAKPAGAAQRGDVMAMTRGAANPTGGCSLMGGGGAVAAYSIATALKLRVV